MNNHSSKILIHIFIAFSILNYAPEVSKIGSIYNTAIAAMHPLITYDTRFTINLLNSISAKLKRKLIVSGGDLYIFVAKLSQELGILLRTKVYWIFCDQMIYASLLNVITFLKVTDL